MPDVPVKLMMNVGTPDQAFAFSKIPNAGGGSRRVHHQPSDRHPPKGLDRLQQLERTAVWSDCRRGHRLREPAGLLVTRVAEGVATLAAAFAPEPVIVRMSDFKSNEYANLVGGELYEPNEENPMIGFRGALCAISHRTSPSVSPWSARPCATSATRWG